MNYIIGNSYDEFISVREEKRIFFDGENINIFVLKKNLDEELVNIFQYDKVFFQLFSREGIIFLLIKFENLKWFDLPFVINENLRPNLKPDGYTCTIHLASTLSGKLYAKKETKLTEGLSRALFWALYKQSKNPVQNIERQINKVHAGFSSDEMAMLSLGK